MADVIRYWQAMQQYSNYRTQRTAYNRIEKSLSKAKTVSEVLAIVQEEGLDVGGLAKPDASRTQFIGFGTLENILEDGTLYIKHEKDEFSHSIGLTANYYLVQNMPIVLNWSISKRKKK